MSHFERDSGCAQELPCALLTSPPKAPWVYALPHFQPAVAVCIRAICDHRRPSHQKRETDAKITLRQRDRDTSLGTSIGGIANLPTQHRLHGPFRPSFSSPIDGKSLLSRWRDDLLCSDAACLFGDFDLQSVRMMTSWRSLSTSASAWVGKWTFALL
jgi:hypothetical protein